MQAQPATTGHSAIIIAHQGTAAEPSPATSASVAPNVSQTPYDRWTDLPGDLVVQVMYWTMLGSGSSRWATSFALTSKQFVQIGQRFRAGPWYQDAQSILMHERTMNWTRAYVNLLAYRPLILAPRNLGELNAALEFMGKGNEGMLHSLNIEEQRHAEPNTDYLGGFRNFQGTTLSLLTGVLETTRDQVVEVARALPPTVCLYVEFSYQVFAQRFDHARVGHFISRVAATGRPTAFNLKWHADLSIRPDQLGEVLEVACGHGMVSFFQFGRMGNPDALLQALCDRCHRFRNLKLVMFECVRPPARDAVAALVAALEKRNAAVWSRLTVVIDCAGLTAGDRPSAPVLSADERAGYERAGLHFECIDTAAVSELAEWKILASVNGEPLHALLPQPLRMAPDASSDDDAFTASSDSDDRLDSSGDEAQAEAAGRPPVQPTPEQPGSEVRSPPRVVKRDPCVIS